MSLARWEAEVAALRREIGATVPMRLRWRWRRAHPWLHASPFDVITRRRPAGYEDEVWLALYPIDAQPGARAQLEVIVAADSDVDQLGQDIVVDVAGDPRPGHAVVVIASGREFWPTYPAVLTLRAPRL